LPRHVHPFIYGKEQFLFGHVVNSDHHFVENLRRAQGDVDMSIVDGVQRGGVKGFANHEILLPSIYLSRCKYRLLVAARCMHDEFACERIDHPHHVHSIAKIAVYSLIDFHVFISGRNRLNHQIRDKKKGLIFPVGKNISCCAIACPATTGNTEIL